MLKVSTDFFPLLIKRTIHFQDQLSEEQRRKVENLIVTEYKSRKVDEFHSEENGVLFRNSLFNGQGTYNFFTPVDGGRIHCLTTHTELTFSIKRMALFAVIMSLLLGVSSLSVFIGLAAFTGFFGVNMLIFWIRTWFFKNRLKEEIDRKVLVPYLPGIKDC
jgi:hypothetical protein